MVIPYYPIWDWFLRIILQFKTHNFDFYKRGTWGLGSINNLVNIIFIRDGNTCTSLPKSIDLFLSHIAFTVQSRKECACLSEKTIHFLAWSPEKCCLRVVAWIRTQQSNSWYPGWQFYQKGEGLPLSLVLKSQAHSKTQW